MTMAKEKPTELEILLEASVNAASDLQGRKARVSFEGNIVAVSNEQGATTITIETDNGGRYTAHANEVTLVS